MSVLDFVRTIPDRGISAFLGDVRVGLRRRSNWLEQRATNVYSREWDVLVILDACRVDLMESVVDDYDFITSVPSLYSVGGTSDEWMQRTFGDVDSATLESTAYVTANAHLQHTDVDYDEFGVLDEVWRYGWDDELGSVRPRTMTDRAIAVHRESDVERLIVHYMQPHAPFLDDPEVTEGMTLDGDPDDSASVDVWDKLRDGRLSWSDVWSAYQRNLCRALDEVALLRENIDADRLVVSADHGNAMGELGQYGHGRHERVDSVCQVPWVVTDATDTGSYMPSVSPDESIEEERGVEETLQALGYK